MHTSIHTHVTYSSVRLERWYLLPGAPELFGMQFEDLRASVSETRVCWKQRRPSINQGLEYFPHLDDFCGIECHDVHIPFFVQHALPTTGVGGTSIAGQSSGTALRGHYVLRLVAILYTLQLHQRCKDGLALTAGSSDPYPKSSARVWT